MKLPYKLLIYDIETSLLSAYIFSLGEQVLRHDQLEEFAKITGIICISYKWFGEKKIHVISGPTAVEEFDNVARQADVCIGKNSFRFDNKHINTQRMLQKLKPYSEWFYACDDLEKQLRKYFTFPSQSLDYISQLLGFGGKKKMEFKDWKDISRFQVIQKLESSIKSNKVLDKICSVLYNKTYDEVIYNGNKALEKMLKYNKKDVLDTENILKRVLPYIQLNYNASVKSGFGCITCGNNKILPDGIIVRGQTKYQKFYCEKCQRYAGKSTYRFDKHRNKHYGEIGK